MYVVALAQQNQISSPVFLVKHWSHVFYQLNPCLIKNEVFAHVGQYGVAVSQMGLST